MSGGSPSPNTEPVFTLFLLMAVFVFVGWIIWAFFRIELLEVLRYFRLAELWGVGLFTNQAAACYEWLKQAPISNSAPTLDNVRMANQCFGAANLAAMMPDQSINYVELTGYSIAAMGRIVGIYLHWPLAIIILWIGFYSGFLSPRGKFKTRYNLEGFIKVQAKMWPVIAPIANFKPGEHSARVPGSTVPDKLPPFAEALSPEEWIAWHRISVTNGIPDREAARRAFGRQLGPRWVGIEGQPPHIRALYAAFALKGVQKREESDDLLSRLSLCWSLERGFRMTSEVSAEIDRLIRDQAVGGEAKNITSQHAYRTTAMLGMLKWARWMGGVLASAQFLWLRAADRSLWYPLNNLGRRSFHVEGSGALAHFMAEQNAKKPLLIPRIDTAIVALNQFLADPERHPMPIPSREEPKARA
jgi:intracellular multiplication protein IcmP